jgi:flagellar biosynthetic protein FliR
MTGVVVYVSLLLARVATFVAVLPLLGGPQTPRSVKAGLALALTVLWSVDVLDPLAGDPVLGQAASWVGWSLALGREVLLGGVFGFAFGLFLAPARIAGEFIGQEIGLSFGNVVTAGGDGSAGPLTVLLELLAALVFFGLDLHHVFLGVLYATLQQYPVGAGLRIPVCDAVGATAAAGEWGVLLAGPVALCLFLTTLVLALLSRAAPQMNLYTVGFPLRMLVGLAAVLLLLPQLVGGFTALAGHFTNVLLGID